MVKDSYAAVAVAVFGAARDSIPQQVQDTILSVVDSMLAARGAQRMEWVDGQTYLRLWVRGDSLVPIYTTGTRRL
ncbi:MAG: hypothetical protein R2910_03450 [Gemmatimonadales bacterium]